jgi:hypothetical protein
MSKRSSPKFDDIYKNTSLYFTTETQRTVRMMSW